MAKTHACVICNEPLSELGSYVKIANMYQHLHCYKKAVREEVVQEAESAKQRALEETVLRAADSARRAYEAAPRCAGCGVTLMEPRPAELNPAFRTAPPSSANPGLCGACLLAEAVRRQAAATQRQPDIAARVAQAAPAPAKEPADPDARWGKLEID